MAADFLPSVWLADDRTARLCRLVVRRTHLVRQRVRLKNQAQAILARNLVPRCPHSDLFGISGRRWLAKQSLPCDEQRNLEALLRQLDFHSDEQKAVERDIAIEGLNDSVVARLMTVPGIHVTAAVSIIAAVGDFSRFESPAKLVAYLGLNPRVKQSGGGPAVHGRITKAGRAQARGMMVEAAFAAARTPGPLRAFYNRVKQRRGFQIAQVAVARKLTVLCWHLIVKDQDYAFARPSLIAHKRRTMELTAGSPSRRGPVACPSRNYFIKQLRDEERTFVEQQEIAYRVMIAHWQPQNPKRATTKG